MKVVILAGGMGTRLQDETKGKIPKPMVTIGGIPILAHIIQNFRDQGFDEFVIAGGFKVEQIKTHFLANRTLADPKVWVVDTGLETRTGGRVKRLARHLREPFLLTYGDGLADINYQMLVDHHFRMQNLHDVLVTLTAVNPPSRFGRLQIGDGICTIFTEKGQDPHGWINSGFYICEPMILELIPGDKCFWEKDILPALAVQGRLSAFQHTGEFQMMDNWRDREYLEGIWESGQAFWTRWGL